MFIYAYIHAAMFFVMCIAGTILLNLSKYILRLYLSHILRCLMAELPLPSNRPPKSRDLGPAMP